MTEPYDPSGKRGGFQAIQVTIDGMERTDTSWWVRKTDRYGKPTHLEAVITEPPPFSVITDDTRRLMADMDDLASAWANTVDDGLPDAEG